MGDLSSGVGAPEPDYAAISDRDNPAVWRENCLAFLGMERGYASDRTQGSRVPGPHTAVISAGGQSLAVRGEGQCIDRPPVPFHDVSIGAGIPLPDCRVPAPGGSRLAVRREVECQSWAGVA